MGTGIIVINPYQIPAESVHQAKRIQQELLNLGVSVDITIDELDNNIIRIDLGYDSVSATKPTIKVRGILGTKSALTHRLDLRQINLNAGDTE